MRQRIFQNFASFLITILVPISLTLLGVRLAMTPQYLVFEYRRADLPADYYGFTAEDRVRYGPAAVDYLVYDQPLRSLSELKLPDGTPFFTTRELEHMDDVQRVAQWAFLALAAIVIVQALLYIVLVRSLPSRSALRRGLFSGGGLTLLILGGVVILVLFAWERFFDQFHELFFAAGTWQFNYSDSLIRLYPVRFWQDTAINIGVFAGVGALLIMGYCQLWSRLERSRT